MALLTPRNAVSNPHVPTSVSRKLHGAAPHTREIRVRGKRFQSRKARVYRNRELAGNVFLQEPILGSQLGVLSLDDIAD